MEQDRLNVSGDNHLPLKGVVLCSTSLTQDVRTKLAETAGQMGAVSSLDLTSQVTHLLVGDIRTPKYKHTAKERPDIKVLAPEWIQAVCDSWMEGEDVDVPSLEEQYRLPTFFGLRICVTGFDDFEQRASISDTVVREGAEYHGDLTRQVTHLVTAAPQGAKYTHAKQWGIPTVSLRWFKDSLHRGMALDEGLYDPAVLEEDQGKDAFRTGVRPRVSLGKRMRDLELQDGGMEETGRRKLRRTASMRLQSQSQDMWQDMSVGNTLQGPTRQHEWQDSTIDAATSGAVEVDRPSFSDAPESQRSAQKLEALHQDERAGIFSGWYILILGFSSQKVKRLQDFLEPNGANVVTSASALDVFSRPPFFRGTCLLVPHSLTEGPLELPPDTPPGTIIATEWWLERCIHFKRFLQPDQDVLSQPFWDTTISGFPLLNISTTGFSGPELRQAAQAVMLVGANYQEKLLPSTSVLVTGGSGTVRREKAYYAWKHQIPVVSAAWLWECLRTKCKVGFEEYRVQLPASDPKEYICELSDSSPARSALLLSGVGGQSRKKEEMLPQRLSNTRRRHATPSLQLQSSRAAAATTAPEKMPHTPFVHEDEDACTPQDNESTALVTTETLSSRRSQPLQELSPNRSSAQLSQLAADAEEDSLETIKAELENEEGNVPQCGPASPPASSPKGIQQLQIRPAEELERELKAIIAHRQASNNISVSELQPRRKGKPLGRAISGISHRSSSFPSHPDPALAPSLAQYPTLLHYPNNEEGFSSNSIADGFQPLPPAPAPPSTQLGYETPEAEAHRLALGKRMGVHFPDLDGGDGEGMRRVQRVGLVRDCGTVVGAVPAAVGARGQRRRKGK